jgi:Cu/Ag efflux protein CusF
MTQKMIPLGSVLLVAMLLAVLAPATRAQITPTPCCPITAIDARTGVVSAKVNASGAAFQFRVTDAALLKSLKVGREVYANFTTEQVSLDGKVMCCTIISPPQAAAPLPPANAPVGKPATAAPKAQTTLPRTVLASIGDLPKISKFELCCTLDTSGVVGPNTVPMWRGTVTQGTINGQNKVLGFSFRPPTGTDTCPGLAGKGNGSLFYADFRTGLLSFDGFTPCAHGIFQIEYTQTVWLDVLPIGVIYVPPGDPHLPTSAAPKQTFQVTNTFATTKNTVTVTSSGQSMTFGAKVLGVAAGGGSSSSNTITTSDNLATSQTRMEGVIAQGPGGYPGQYDQIVWYTNPTYDVTYNSSYTPQPGPSAVLAGQIISIVSHPHSGSEPQWLFCHATVQDLQLFQGNAFACLNQLPKPSAPKSGNNARSVGLIQTTPAQKLLSLDPMVGGEAVGTLAYQGGPQSNPASVPANHSRFQPMVPDDNSADPISVWTYCAEDTPTPFGASDSRMHTDSTTTTIKFTSNVSLTLDPAQIASEISGVPLPAGTSSSIGVGDTWETDYTVSNSIQKGTTWSVNGNFGGGTIPASQCQTPTAYNTTMFYDSFSSSVLFWTETVPPNSGTSVSGATSAAPPPATGARVLFTPAGGGRPYQVLVNPAGQYRLTLPTGNYTYQVVDRTGQAMASAARVAVPPKQSSPLRLPTINIGSIAGAAAAASLPAPQRASTLSVATPAATSVAAGAIQNKVAPVATCCNITAINTSTGVVTATESATARIFEFKLNDATLLNSLQVGRGVYANFAAGQVSLDGIMPGGPILSAASAPAAAPSAVGKIAAIDINTGVVTATENATGQTFRFMVKDRKLAGTLRAGVSVDFSKSTGLSLNGFAGGCCTPIFHHVDCSLTPTACPGGQKPKGHIRLTGSFWDDLNDFCGNTGDTTGNCVDPTQPGPNTMPPAPDTAPPLPPPGDSGQGGKAGQQKPQVQQSPSNNNAPNRNNFGLGTVPDVPEGSTEGAIRGVTASPGNSPAGPTSYHGVRIKGVFSPASENAKGEADPPTPAILRPAIQTPAAIPSRLPPIGSLRLASTQQGKQLIQQATAMLGGVNMHASLLGGHKYMVTSCLGIKASAGTFDLVIPDPALTFDAGGVHLTLKIARVNMNALSVRFEPNPGNLLDPCTFSDQVGIGGYVEDIQYDISFDPIEDLEACRLGSMGKVDYKISIGKVRLEPLPPEVGNVAKDMINDALLLSFSAATQLDPVDEETMLINRLLAQQCPLQPRR